MRLYLRNKTECSILIKTRGSTGSTESESIPTSEKSTVLNISELDGLLNEVNEMTSAKDNLNEHAYGENA